jgi:hypothetical protein
VELLEQAKDAPATVPAAITNCLRDSPFIFDLLALMCGVYRDGSWKKKAAHYHMASCNWEAARHPVARQKALQNHAHMA